jgi:aspartate/methionine/tyrosine aminotransferase
MRYRRMPIEVESPEELGYGRIRCNLAESSIADRRLVDLGLQLDDLLLQYGDHRGDPRLRSAIAEETGGADRGDAAERGGGAGQGASDARPGDVPLTADDVLLTPGAAGALFIVATTLLGPGDHVIVARPNYATNLETPRAIGADIETLDLRHEDGWHVDPERIAAMLRASTRLVSLTSPHNPTGQVIDESDLRAIVRIVDEHGRARLLLDETYRDMAFHEPTPPVATLSSRAIGVSSLSKSYGLPGIRTGWLMTRDPDLLDRFLAAKEQIMITGSVVDEAIAFGAYTRRRRLLPSIRVDIERAFATTRRWIEGQEVFEWVAPSGGVVAFPRARPGLDLDGPAFHRRLFDAYGTIVGPGHWFDQPDTAFRLGYGWPTPDRLADGLEALSAVAAELLG